METYIIIALVVAAIGYAIYEERNKSSKTPSKTPATKATSRVKSEAAHSVASLKKLTKQQLLDLADKNSIKVKRSGSKAEVVKAIAQHK